ncbi:hypothetical protein KDA_13120 [Dictyobacter alpinus]|uniref:Uncharacterized protein n=1 Tax=Dictyobacter alpinus TaxID=2014873 RepID=A0A402B3C0_9CHLR|nr:hypothetical protein [Dictyobacter alpinus]GCE25828.1 hypothetical protein KDA_13120 [Dictyobacter alpinus]
MIKCNRCGNMTPAGAVCQACGAPLAGMVDNGPAQRMGFQDQPELPAWLESLRAGERSAPPANNPGSFSPADLIEEGAFPSWMRSERGDSRDNTAANPPVSARPASESDQVPEFGNAPSQGFTAQSLIDEKSLPSWMQEGKSAAPPAPSTPGSLDASSLIQSDNLPDWMRTLQQQPGPRNNPAPQQPAPRVNPAPQQPVQPQAPLAPAPSPGVGFSARDLIDQQALPSWMQPQNERTGNTGSSFPVNQNQPAPNIPAPPTPGQTGFSASSLLDIDALPSWMQEGGKHTGQQPGNNPPAPTAQSGAWPTAQSNPAWPPVNQQPAASFQQQPMQTPPMGGGAPAEGNQLSAASFIDPNALPEWMRSAGGQSGQMPSAQPGMGSGVRPGAYGVPPRVENMRVPSRPRGEVNSNESSELAANVFASMLGVASATPNYPAQQQQPQMEQPGQANPFGQSNQPGQANNPFGQPNQGASANLYGQPDVGNMYGQPSQPNQGNMYGQPGQTEQGNLYGQSGQPNQGNMYGQLNQPGPMGQSGISQPSMGGMPNTPQGMSGVFPQNYGAGNSLSGMYGNNYPGNQGQGNPAMGGPSAPNPSAGPSYSGNAYPTSAQSSASDAASDQKNNKKRGLFEAIREWLSR